MRTKESVAIDVVYTWVDGSDPVHKEKRQQYAGRAERGGSVSGHEDTRWACSGELLLSVFSIRKYAPWVSNIFVVTDQQTPEWLDSEFGKSLNITLIDHREIFAGFEVGLPTFNSLSIESLIFRVPGVSNKFLYMNDDFSLVGDVSVSNFFRGEFPVYRGRWMSQYKKGQGYFSKKAKKIREKIKDYKFGVADSFTASQRRAAEMMGYDERFFRLSHSPFPVLRDDFESVMSIGQRLPRNAGYRFRNRRQFSPIALVAHLLIGERRADAKDDSDALYVDAREMSPSDIGLMREIFDCGEKKMLCLQSLDMSPVSVRRALVTLVADHMGFPDEARYHLLADDLDGQAAHVMGGRE